LSRDHEAALVGAGIEYSNRYNLSVAEVVAEYESCDLVTLVSTYEGFGMPIVEGNSVGRPVITSNVASMPEVAGDAACLVDPFDVPSIRAGILRVIRDEEYRQQLVANGFRNAERFTAARVAELYEAIYEELDPDLRHPRVNGEGITAGACPASL
jgi:glycosyltransferase involved in cell wall biosynthesis